MVTQRMEAAYLRREEEKVFAFGKFEFILKMLIYLLYLLSL